MEKRLEAPSLNNAVKRNIKNALPQQLERDNNENREEPERKKKRYCYYCPSKIRRMSKMVCVKCSKSICGEHKNVKCAKLVPVNVISK